MALGPGEKGAPPPSRRAEGFTLTQRVLRRTQTLPPAGGSPPTSFQLPFPLLQQPLRTHRSPGARSSEQDALFSSEQLLLTCRRLKTAAGMEAPGETRSKGPVAAGRCRRRRGLGDALLSTQQSLHPHHGWLGKVPQTDVSYQFPLHWALAGAQGRDQGRVRKRQAPGNASPQT